MNLKESSNSTTTLRVLRGLIFPFLAIHLIFLIFYYINGDIPLVKFILRGGLELVFSILLFIILGKLVKPNMGSRKEISKVKTVFIIWFFIILSFIMGLAGFLFAYLLFKTQSFSVPVILLCIWGIFYTYLAIYGIVLFIKNYHIIK